RSRAHRRSPRLSRLLPLALEAGVHLTRVARADVGVDRAPRCRLRREHLEQRVAARRDGLRLERLRRPARWHLAQSEQVLLEAELVDDRHGTAVARHLDGAAVVTEPVDTERRVVDRLEAHAIDDPTRRGSDRLAGRRPRRCGRVDRRGYGNDDGQREESGPQLPAHGFASYARLARALIMLGRPSRVAMTRRPSPLVATPGTSPEGSRISST